MPRYLFEAAYTNDSWATQVQSRENVVERVRPLAEGLGGRVLDAYYAFGEYDVIVLLEFPTNEAAAAWSLAISAGGSVKASKTIPLMTVEEGRGAMQQAAEAAGRYHPPVPR
jgi:uncharacterized protein with GYD domain